MFVRVFRKVVPKDGSAFLTDFRPIGRIAAAAWRGVLTAVFRPEKFHRHRFDTVWENRASDLDVGKGNVWHGNTSFLYPV